MSSVFRTAFLTIAACATLGAGPPLRVCADPNNLPFSNREEQGFENRIAALVARDMRRPLAYVWSPQRRGFVRNTLNAGACDVVMGLPAHYRLLQPTRAYYLSSYVFVTRQDRHLHIQSFDDGRLRRLAIGIQIAGDDYANPPAAQALAARQIVQNVRGYTLYGDYSQPDPQREIIDAVAGGKVDVAVVWGPLAGYYARLEPVPIRVTPVGTGGDPTSPFAFDIAMGVRSGDVVLRETLDAIIGRRLAEMHRILRMYGVPLQ